MKKLFIFLNLILSTFYFSQFKVEDSSDNWTEIGFATQTRLFINSEKSKAKIIFLNYNNMMNPVTRFNEYKFEFQLEPDTLEKLYQLIIENLQKKEAKEITLSFPDGKVYLSFLKSFGGGFVFAFEFENSLLNDLSNDKITTYWLNEKQVNKFFGKKTR